MLHHEISAEIARQHREDLLREASAAVSRRRAVRALRAEMRRQRRGAGPVAVAKVWQSSA